MAQAEKIHYGTTVWNEGEDPITECCNKNYSELDPEAWVVVKGFYKETQDFCAAPHE